MLRCYGMRCNLAGAVHCCDAVAVLQGGAMLYSRSIHCTRAAPLVYLSCSCNSGLQRYMASWPARRLPTALFDAASLSCSVLLTASAAAIGLEFCSQLQPVCPSCRRHSTRRYRWRTTHAGGSALSLRARKLRLANIKAQPINGDWHVLVACRPQRECFLH